MFKNIGRLSQDKEIFTKVEQKLCISQPSDWYKISITSLNQNIRELKKKKEIENILSVKEQDFFNCLQIYYPNTHWKYWLFTVPLSSHFWEQKQNQRWFFQDISDKNGLKYPKDWYNIKTHDLLNFAIGGTHFITQIYHSSIQKVLLTLFPEYNEFLFAWKFRLVSRFWWSSLQNQKLFIKEFEKDFNFKSSEDWYSYSVNDFRKKGSYLLLQYPSMFHLLQNIYPHIIWLPWNFKSTPKLCWSGLQGKYNTRQYFDMISKSENIIQLKNWYSIKWKDTSKLGSYSILNNTYNSSPLFCLSDIYPEILWQGWKFPKTPISFWNIDQNTYSFLSWYEKKMKMKSKKEWYFVTFDQLRYHGANSLLKKFKSVNNIVNYYFPKEGWNKKNFKPGYFGQKSQFKLFKIIQNIFKNENIELNYKHPNIKFLNSKKKIEFDIFIPSLNLAFEYQGIHHYEATVFSNTNTQKERDLEKLNLCKNNSISLIQVPYFVEDLNQETILPMILSIRPDIFK